MLSIFRRSVGAAASLSRAMRPTSVARLACRPLSSAPIEAAGEVSSVTPAAFTSDLRPPGDTSRKWVKVDSIGRAYATGRRKTAVARVWVWPSADDELASVRVNKQNLSSFFGGHWVHRHTVLAPFFETGTAGKYSVMATVKGGGINGPFRPRLDSLCLVSHSFHLAETHVHVLPRRMCAQARPRRCGMESRRRCRVSTRRCARR